MVAQLLYRTSKKCVSHCVSGVQQNIVLIPVTAKAVVLGRVLSYWFPPRRSNQKLNFSLEALVAPAVPFILLWTFCVLSSLGTALVLEQQHTLDEHNFTRYKIRVWGCLSVCARLYLGNWWNAWSISSWKLSSFGACAFRTVVSRQLAQWPYGCWYLCRPISKNENARVYVYKRPPVFIWPPVVPLNLVLPQSPCPDFPSSKTLASSSWLSSSPSLPSLRSVLRSHATPGQAAWTPPW